MINLEISDFKAPFLGLNGNHILNINRMDLARALVTVGRNSWGDVYQQGLFRIGELICKAFAFSKMESGNLCLNDSFYSLNQSEKVTVSYYFGQALTKLFAEHKLNVPWLLHIDGVPDISFHNKGTATSKKIIHKTKKNAKSPDLYGLSGKNRVHILESKGNSGGYSLEIMQHAINQVSQVDTYNGVQPLTKTACYFDLSTEPIKGIIIDPDNDGLGIDIEMNEEKPLDNFYSFFKKNSNYFNTPIKIGNDNYLMAAIGIPSLFFGFNERILNLESSYLLKNGLYNEGELLEINKSNLNTSFSIGSDGIILIDNFHDFIKVF